MYNTPYILTYKSNIYEIFLQNAEYPYDIMLATLSPEHSILSLEHNEGEGGHTQVLNHDDMMWSLLIY